MIYQCLHHGAIDNDRFGLCLVTGIILTFEIYRVIAKLQGAAYPLTDARLTVYRIEHVIFGAFWYGVVYQYAKISFARYWRRRHD